MTAEEARLKAEIVITEETRTKRSLGRPLSELQQRETNSASAEVQVTHTTLAAE